MSRTYRLRRYPSKIAARFGEASYTIYIAERHGLVNAIVAHGIYNMPCIEIGRPVVHHGMDEYGWWSTTVNEHDQCLFAQYRALYWAIIPQLRYDILGEQYLKISSVYYHEYVRVHRRSRWDHDTTDVRRHMAMKMRKVLISGDDSYV